MCVCVCVRVWGVSVFSTLFILVFNWHLHVVTPGQWILVEAD